MPMRHLAFYSRIFGIVILIALIIYIGLSAARFFYYRNIGIALRDVSKQTEYTLGKDHPLYQVAVLGDSTAYGVGATDYQHTYHYLALANQDATFHVQNFGVSGARMADLEEQLAQVERVDLMFISICGNDITHFTRLTDLRQQLESVLTAAEKKAKTVVLITPGSFENAFILPSPIRWLLVWRGGQVSTLAKEVAAQHARVISVDMYSHAESDFSQNPDLYFATDFFHPSDAGYELWTQAIEKDVEAAGGLNLPETSTK